MKELFAGITTHFKTTNTLNTLLSGQLYPHEAPQNASFPYGIYYLITDFNEVDFSDTHEHINIQFSLFSDEESMEQILNIFDAAKSLFDFSEITVTGHTLIDCARSNAFLKRDTENETWSYIIDYDILLEKQRS